VTTYRPSAVVRLTLRAEEFEETSTLEELLPEPDYDFTEPEPEPDYDFTVPEASTASRDDSAADRLARNQERRRTLEGRRDSMPAEQYATQLSELTAEEQGILADVRQTEDSSDVGTAPQSVAGSPPDDLTVIGAIHPVSATIERNGLAQADTATIELAWVDAPIDPRVVRAAHVQLVIGSVSADDFEAGVSRSSTRTDGTLTSIVASELEGVTEFVGFVDRWAVDYSEKGDRVRLECRDMSAPLRDRQLGDGERIDMSLAIDRAVASFCERLGPTTAGLEVVFQGEGDAPTPVASMPQRRRPRRGQQATRGASGGDRMSAWDHITDVVRSVGFIPMMRGFRLVIVEPRTLYSTEGVTRMVYGRDLEQLRFERSLLGVTVPTIEVRCYDSERGVTQRARYPVAEGQRSTGVVGQDQAPRPGRANRVPPSGSTPDDAIRVMSVTGITDLAVLERIARGAFEQLGRQEIEGSFSTKDIWSFETDPADADLLDLDAGSAVELLMTQADDQDARVEGSGEAVTLARITAMSRERRRDYLISIGWDRDVAERFSALQDATGFQTVFRVSRCSLRYSADNGVSVSVDFINFITVREER